MQFRIIPSIVVFLGSYLPLAVILLAQDFQYKLFATRLCFRFFDPNSGCVLPFANPGYSVTTFVLCSVCFCASLATLVASRPQILVNVTEARYIPAELMSYTLPYVVSFMSLDYHETGKFVGLVIFLGWMFWITHKSGQLILNPVFTAFGWRLYEITYTFPGDTKERHGRALSHPALEQGLHEHTTIQDILIFRPKPENV